MADIETYTASKDLRRLRDWAKNVASGFLDGNEFSKVKLAMEILELSEELEKKLMALVELGTSAILEPGPLDIEEEVDSLGYPIFSVKGEFLVKQGRTRDKRGIYEQKLPRVEFERIVGALREIAQHKKEFDIRDLLSLVQVPNYQIYLLLGALQDLGMIQIPRRGMYSFVEPKRFLSDSSFAWQKLASNFMERR